MIQTPVFQKISLKKRWSGLRIFLYNCTAKKIQTCKMKEVVNSIKGPVAGLVGIEGGVVSGVFNLESPDVSASGRRPRHENRYHDA
jgi:hypothetical protein